VTNKLLLPYMALLMVCLSVDAHRSLQLRGGPVAAAKLIIRVMWKVEAMAAVLLVFLPIYQHMFSARWLSQ